MVLHTPINASLSKGLIRILSALKSRIKIRREKILFVHQYSILVRVCFGERLFVQPSMEGVLSIGIAVTKLVIGGCQRWLDHEQLMIHVFLFHGHYMCLVPLRDRVPHA